MTKYKLEILHDEAPVDPYKDWDFLGKIVTWHRRYAIGDQPKMSKAEYKSEVIDFHDSVVLDIYMLADDSLSTDYRRGGRHVGYIFVGKDRLKDEKLADKTEDEVKEVLAAEVKVYDHYHMGNVWGFKLYKICECCGQPSEVEDSCWGFYGTEVDETGIEDHLAHFGDEVTSQIEDAWDKRLEASF